MSPADILERSGDMDFSLFYFAADAGSEPGDSYRLLIEGARFADEHGFAAVWTPERHFHAFGGLYPNPAVTAAAVAAITRRVAIRAGSVVLPLHDPIRVTEDWSVIDRMSNGRTGISFASGWHADDFVLAPLRYAERKRQMVEAIETVRHLWRGGSVTLPNGTGAPVEVRTLPRPIQPELPVWLTTAGTPASYEAAGGAGFNLLTHLLGQSLDDLAGKVKTYRQAWTAAGHPGHGHVTLMVHTLVGPSLERVRDLVRQPLIEYLKTSVDLSARQVGNAAPNLAARASLSEDDVAVLAEHGFHRYFPSSGLFGTVDDCVATAERLRAAGVDEIACLIDFGVPVEDVLESLLLLDKVRHTVQRQAPVAVSAASGDAG